MFFGIYPHIMELDKQFAVMFDTLFENMVTLVEGGRNKESIQPFVKLAHDCLI